MSARKLFKCGARLQRVMRSGTAGALVVFGITTSWSGLVAEADSPVPAAPAAAAATATPIQHLVVIYQENVSFDHYFGTYPNAANVAGEPSFTAQSGTVTPNNYVSNSSLLTSNPNLNSANGSGATNPFRLDRTQAATADQNHNYQPEQSSFDGGKMDLFPKNVGTGTTGGAGAFGTTGLTMGYYDGNTVTGLWNYAQGFAMSDNSFGDQFGPSTPGAVNVVSGQTNGVNITHQTSSTWFIPDGQGGISDINDADPSFDACSLIANGNEFNLSGRSIGDLLTAANIPWGGFMGGFNLVITNPNGTTGCARSTLSAVTAVNEPDYIQHHNWFMYFAGTLNANHARPTSSQTIGLNSDPANHEYDIQDFVAAVNAGNFPPVAFIKMPSYQDGHAGYSDPLDEQNGIVTLLNFLQQQPAWSNTAVVIAYDDSDGWYDHAMAATTSSSFSNTGTISTSDTLNGLGVCGTGTQQNGVGGKPVNGRCGPGPRLPFMVISPWSKQNYISHVQTSQVSTTRFIEDNWLGGQRLGGGSFDANAGSIMDMFNFTSSGGSTPRVFLYPASGLRLRTLTHDFADGGFSGVAWRDMSGNLGMWLMNGSQIAQSSVLGNVPANWTLVGQQVLNSSGAADLIWRDTSGNLGVWFMNGKQVVSTAVIGNVPTNWTLVGTAPFTGNGAELFWQDTSGNIAVWVINGTQVVSSTVLGNAPTNWSVVGAGDFTGTGNTGLLWRDTSGNVGMWLMNGTKIVSSSVLGNVPTSWTVIGTGDFNGDGTTDILWRDASGNVAMWLMNGTQITQTSVIGNVPLTWSVGLTGDYNGDGKSDILWVNNSGTVGAWFMNGVSISSTTTYGSVGTNWQVQSTNAE